MSTKTKPSLPAWMAKREFQIEFSSGRLLIVNAADLDDAIATVRRLYPLADAFEIERIS